MLTLFIFFNIISVTIRLCWRKMITTVSNEWIFLYIEVACSSSGFLQCFYIFLLLYKITFYIFQSPYTILGMPFSWNGFIFNTVFCFPSHAYQLGLRVNLVFMKITRLFIWNLFSLLGELHGGCYVLNINFNGLKYPLVELFSEWAMVHTGNNFIN